jgi:hypothetical protein
MATTEASGETGQFPPLMARKLGGRASVGLLIQAAVCLVLAVVFKLDYGWKRSRPSSPVPVQVVP